MKWTSYLILAGIFLLFCLVQGGIFAQKYWFPKQVESVEARLMPVVVDVGTPVSGIVHTVAVTEGQHVKKGDILFVVMHQSPLQPHGGNQIIISAHRSGMVTGIIGVTGKFVQASQVLATIVDRTQAVLYVEADLPMMLDDLGLIHPPHAATVHARFLNDGEPIAAAITSVHPHYDVQSGIVQTRLHFLEPVRSSIPIVVGMPVDVALQIENVNRFKDTTLRIVQTLVPASTARALP